MSERGFYGVFEGSDGTGKSLQAVRATEHLVRLGLEPVVVFNDETGRLEPIQEPGGTETANALRRKIKDKSIERTPWQNVEWFTAARKSNWEELIKPALDAGRPVITARNYISTIAYQGYGEGIPIQDILEYTREEVGEAYMAPDFMAVLALRNEMTRQKRLQQASRTLSQDKDTFESMPPEFQSSMQNGYVRYAEANGLEVIDADVPPDALEDYLWGKIKPLIDERS